MGSFYLRLPLVFLKFWFLEAPRWLVSFFASFNKAFLQLFSLPLLLKTYFKPWKNEYRKGLVGFSIGMGIFIKSIVIAVDIVLLLLILAIQLVFILGFILLPIATLFLFDRLFLFLLSLLCISVVFFIFKPHRTMNILASKKSVTELIKSFLQRPDVQFLLQKADIKKEEVALIEIPKPTGTTELGFFASYLLATEENTKLLFQKNLKKEDLLNISHWAKSMFPGEELKKPFRVKFSGEGIGENWVYGWTIETKKYMVDLTKDALGKKPLLLGRQEEYKEAIEGLYKNRSVLLVGEPGSGKTSLIEALAYESMTGNLKDNLYHQRFFQLLVDSLIAGSQNQGELQGRIDSVIEEIAHSNNIIIFIPDLENILGSPTFNLDLSGILIPYIKRNEIRIVATIVPSFYKKFVEPMHSLLDVFEVVRFDEPDKDTIKQMLLEKTLEIEKKNNVSISYRAVVSALSLGDLYLQNRVKPGNCVRLLEDTANEVFLKGKKIVEEQDVIDKVEKKTKILVGMPTGEEKELLLHLEDQMHKYIIDQKDAVFAVSRAMRRLRSEIDLQDKPISFLFLGPTGVGKTKTAKVLSSLYFGENKMIRFDMSEYAANDSIKRLLGGLPDKEGLTDKVYNQPFSLILLDEFEKAAPSIRDLFLQVLDDGRLTDNKGQTVSFVNTIIIATSNAGSEFIREQVKKGTAIDKGFKSRLLEFLQENGIFKPELLNRFDDIIVFKPLGESEIVQITKLILNDLTKKLLEKDIVVTFDNKVIEKILKDGFDEQFGARPIRRFIQDNIEDLIAKKMLEDEIKRGNRVLFSTDDANIITITVS